MTTPRGTRTPQPVDAWYHDHLFHPNAQTPAQVIESAREADRVLYGPTGEVLVRIEDRKRVGFR